MLKPALEINRELYDEKADVVPAVVANPGITKEVVIQISKSKNEPDWMLQKRLDALETFEKLSIPNWGCDLSELNLDKITYFALPDAKQARKWEDVPVEIKKTFEKLGIPEAEQRALAGAGAQFESASVYHNLKEEWEKQGVVFIDLDEAVHRYPDLVKENFMTKCIPAGLHKFAALHGAVWSGGTFLYVPKGVKVTLPMQAYFRMNAEKMGQFEHTLIIIDEGAEAHYIEGCSSPRYNESSLHAGGVELFVKKGAKLRYSSIENWSKNTYNMNTKRAIVEEDGVIEWVTANMGSNKSMVYPCSFLTGKNARAVHISVAFANKDQHQDVGAKVYHLAENTSSVIKSKSISKGGGITTYRGLLSVKKGAVNSRSKVQCDALIMDEQSKSDTIPYMDIKEKDVDVAHEATVGKISQEKILYLMSRGLSEEQAVQTIVQGFVEPMVKELPLEYAVEFNRLVQMEIEGL